MECTKPTSINITYNTSLTQMKNENGVNFQKLAKGSSRTRSKFCKRWSETQKMIPQIKKGDSLFNIRNSY